MSAPLWIECTDPDVRQALYTAWARLPRDAQQRLAHVKVYSVRDLKASDGERVLGLASQGQIKISTIGHPTSRALLQVVAHEFSHQYLDHIGQGARLTASERKAIEPQQEREVIAQLRAWGFGGEVDENSRYWGDDPRLAQGD